MSDFWNQISPSDGTVPLSAVAARSKDVVVSMVRKAGVSRADAETIQGRVEKRYGAGDGTGWDGPKLLDDWDWLGDGGAPYSLVWEEGPDDWAFEDWDAGLNVFVEPITSWALGIYPNGKTASEENTCRNCDKPTSGEYCSNTCEDSDRFPAAQDDQEKFTKGASEMENSWQTDFDANAAYWSGAARAAEQQRAAEQRLRDMKGQEIEVVKGRKVPIGTRGTVFYSGQGQYGWRIGFKDAAGNEYWTDASNVDLVSELSSTSRRKTAEWNHRLKHPNTRPSYVWFEEMYSNDFPVDPSNPEGSYYSAEVFLTPAGVWEWQVSFISVSGSESTIDSGTASSADDGKSMATGVIRPLLGSGLNEDDLAAYSSRTAAGRRCQFCNKAITFGGMQWQDTTTGTDCPSSNVGHSPSPREDVAAPRKTAGDDANLEWTPWAEIPDDKKRGEGEDREVYGETFSGEPTWVPYMSKDSVRKTAGPMGINVGDIFYNSWGYDQTNVDFYEVVRTTERMVEIKPIQSRVVEGGAYSQSVEPVRGSYRDYDVIIDTGRSSPYGQPERQTKMCRVRDGYNGGPAIVLSSDHSAYPYKGGSLSESGPYGGH